MHVSTYTRVFRSREASDMTLAEHAEAWWAEQGKIVPPRETPEWQAMYEAWHRFAFTDFNARAVEGATP